MKLHLKPNRNLALAFTAAFVFTGLSSQAGNTNNAAGTNITAGTNAPIGAKAGGFREIDLVSDQAGVARFQDTNLVNSWGLIVGPRGRLVVADNETGVATFYSPGGRPSPLVITIPSAGTNTGSPGPVDLALNRFGRGFAIGTNGQSKASVLLFVTEQGTILGWNPLVNRSNAVVAVDNSTNGAVYKGMALAGTTNSPRLYAANFGQGVVEMYGTNFEFVSSFTDTNLTGGGYVPFGIRRIGQSLFVTFALKPAPDSTDEQDGPGLGFVDEFDFSGNLVRRFASQGTLNAPWGLALAPRRFGQFSRALLVGNFGDGAINAFDPASGAFLGQLTDTSGNVLHIDRLWGLAFGPRFNSPLLFFTAGPDDESHGLLGVLVPTKRKH